MRSWCPCPMVVVSDGVRVRDRVRARLLNIKALTWPGAPIAQLPISRKGGDRNDVALTHDKEKNMQYA